VGSTTPVPRVEGPGGYADTVFEQLNEKNGMPGSVAQAIAQDDNGFIWVGTANGASRWDGYRFRTYVMDAGIAGSLPSNNVLTLYVDPQKRLWIGTNRGISLYLPVLDSFQTFTPAGSGGAYPSIYSIVTDGAGGLWLATRKGLDHFEPNGGNFNREPMEGITGGFNTQAVLRDPDGRVWAGGTKGLFLSDTSGHQFKAVTITTGKPPTVWSLMRDQEKRLWIGTTAGAFVLEPGAAVPRQIHETRDQVSAAPQSVKSSPLDTQGVDAMIEPEPGIVWLGTYGEGIVEVDTRSWLTHRIVHQPSIPTSLSHDLVDALFRDREGTVWAGTLAGLSRKNSTGKGFLTFYGGVSDATHPIADSDVTAVMSTRDGRLWLGLLEKGIDVFDASGRRLNGTRSGSASPADQKMQQVNAFAQVPDGTMYFGSQQGLFHADRDGRHVVPVPFSSSVQAVGPLFYDAGQLWIGASTGLWMLPLPSMGNLRQTERQAGPLLPGTVNSMARGLGDDLWVGTVTSLYRVNVVTHAFERTDIAPAKPGALPAAITSLMVDRDGRLWVSTDGAGLYQLEPGSIQGRMVFRKLTDVDAGQIFQMPDGRVWFAGDHGISRIDPQTLAVQSFKQADGVAIDTYWLNGGGLAPDGRLILGGTGGLTVVQPQAVKQWSYAAPVIVTEFSTGEQLNPAAQFLANSGTGTVQVQPHARSFAVEFSALDFTDPEENQYAYRMVGFDHDWVLTSASRRIARYTNLSPGRYTLELKGSNRSGVWGTTRSIPIRILPAWYQTVWAKLGAAVLAGTLVFWLLNIYTAILRARQRQLERQVALRTAELEDITVQLQRSQQELTRIAYLDSLTGLANRRMFADCFQGLIDLKKQQGGSFTLLLIDLDKFKAINDEYGHDVGDALLCEVASRLGAVASQKDCLARLGGDEFAILLAETTEQPEIDQLWRMIVQVLNEPLVLKDCTLRITLSMGAAIFPQDGTEQESLYKSADLSLYRVKREGRNGWRRATGEQ
jgi:diguanylate cyclase (GGDEF)-like protein